MTDDGPIWIRGPDLRKRWGDVPRSTFYLRLKAGLIPAPVYPFGPIPHWRMADILAFEASAPSAPPP